MFFVYIIESEKQDRYYIGQTENLESRLKRHNQGRNISTKAYIPWRLKWWKLYDTRAEAIREEMKLKRIKKVERLEKYVSLNEYRGVAQPG
jgi:putative endonuclease